MSREKTPFRRTIIAGYADAFNGREVRPSSVMTYLEETAAEHCASVGRDIFTLLEDGGGWVLLGGGMQMYRYPRYGEEITIETWISRWKRFSGIREYRLYSADGNLIGEAGGRWVFWDLATRKPTAIPDVFRDKWYYDIDSPYKRLSENFSPTSDEWNFQTPESVILEVRRGDVDLYGHLHNTTYLDWLMEAVPVSLWSGGVPMDLGIQFVGEARLGESVEFLSISVDKGWFHEVRRVGDDKLLVKGYTRWDERASVLIA